MFRTKLMLVAVIALFGGSQAQDFDLYDIESKIVQGQNAARGQFPYYVSILPYVETH